MANTLTFPLTPEEFAAKKDRLRESGVSIPDTDAGEISSHGITVDYAYDGQVLSVTIKHKPVLYPESLVEGRITTWFHSS